MKLTKQQRQNLSIILEHDIDTYISSYADNAVEVFCQTGALTVGCKTTFKVNGDTLFEGVKLDGDAFNEALYDWVMVDSVLRKDLADEGIK